MAFSLKFKKLENKRETLAPVIIFFSAALLYFYWVLKTYRNELHMDVMYLVATKIKHLYENKLSINDFFYQPLYLGIVSTTFIFINAKLFHLNTIVEVSLGAIFLTILGYKYLKEMNRFLSGYYRIVFFPFLIAFLVFGLQKWEAIFTPAFSFGVFFDLCICVFNFFVLAKSINDEQRVKPFHAILFFFLNLVLILDSAAYFFSYILSLLLILILVSKDEKINKRNWRTFLYLTGSLLLLSLMVVFAFSFVSALKRPASDVSISTFLSTFIQKPIWIIKFYLIASSGPFYGEAPNKLEIRALLGLFILTLYVLAIIYVVRKRKRNLYVPAGMILHNIISYAFITSSRYVFNSLEYGASSRYTAFNLLGVLGLYTILFFYIVNERGGLKKSMASVSLGILVLVYALVYNTQFKILPYRTSAFLGFQKALLTGDNLPILQADTAVSAEAINVLRKYDLNVYYHNDVQSETRDTLSLQTSGKLEFTAGTKEFEELIKTGFYEFENANQFSWTSGRATILLNDVVAVKDTLIGKLYVNMPEISKNIVPQIVLIDKDNINYPLNLKARGVNIFTYSLILDKPAMIDKIKIMADSITSHLPDTRILSFPFRKLEVLQAKKELLNSSDFSILQPDSAVGLTTILQRIGKVEFIAGTASFEEFRKQGFHNYEPGNKFCWTDGNAAIMFENPLSIKDSLFVKLSTYMPEVCKNINPKIVLENKNNSYPLKLKRRDGNLFTYSLVADKMIKIDRIRILADTIVTNDARRLSFPFIGLEILK
jgi:hypothetical protein